jgi:hypothetical protein
MIADAKVEFAATIDGELDDLREATVELVRRVREAAQDARGLNDLAASFNGIACTLEHAGVQIEDTRAEARKWLGQEREPIHEYVSPTIVAQVRGELVA